VGKQGETKFKEHVRTRLDAIPHSWWVKIQMVALRGIPDFLGLINGRFIALELKVEDNEADGLQSYNLRKIAQCGGICFVVKPSNLDIVIAQLNKLGEQHETLELVKEPFLINKKRKRTRIYGDD